MVANYRKKVGIPLCIFFGTALLGNIYTTVSTVMEAYDQTVSSVMWILFSSVKCACLLYLALGNGLCRNVVGKIGAWILAVLTFIYVVNNIAVLCDYNLFTFMGSSATLVLSILSVAAWALLVFNLNVWMVAKIGSLIYFVLNVILGILIICMHSAWEYCMEIYDFGLIDTLNTCIVINNVFAVILLSGMLALMIVWTCTKEKTPPVPQR